MRALEPRHEPPHERLMKTKVQNLISSYHRKCGFLVTVFLLTLLNCGRANALIEIEITKGGADAIPIAVVPFGWDGSKALPEDIAQIVASDLTRSGLFEPLLREELVGNPVSGDVPNYSAWRSSGVEFLVIGSVLKQGSGYKVNYELIDPIDQKVLAGYTLTVTNQTLRTVAHQIADEIYEEVIGIRGAFNTQIAYISVSGTGKARRHQLQLADADGRSPQSMLTSPRPIMSPSWAPDGVRIAYVSFEDRERSAIYIQDRKAGKRTKVISREGINGAPSWSPDGRSLAIVLSYEGNPDIYVVDVATGKTRRVTNSDAIDTEPAWLDDGTLVFTSDRSGGPQLYRIPVAGGKARRLTFEGSYNASASISPTGDNIAFVHREGGQYRIAVLELSSGDFRVLTEGSLDESPSFAPNGQMILFASSNGNKQTLGAVSVDGDVVQSLSLESGGVREPAWSPFTN